jgi:alkaline phosphatase D
MKTIIKIFICCLLISWFGNSANAQHDAHREAVIEMAIGDYDSAGRRIEKVLDDPSALWRSLQNAYERAGRTVQREGEEYQRFVIPENYFVMSMLSALKGESQKALDYAKKAASAGLPFERLVVGPRDAFSALHQMKVFQEWVENESPDLIHGPMLGNVTADAASFWVRTFRESEVKVEVQPQRGYKSEKKKFSLFAGCQRKQNTEKSGLSKTSADKDYTTIVRIDGLLPNTTYNYRLYVDNKLIHVADSSFRTNPEQGEPAQFSIAFGGGAGYVPEHERVWATIKQRDPHALLMLGDNVYIDDPEHLLTHRYCYYRRQSRPEWRELISGRGVYAIWDDHDFGMDDSYGGPEIENPQWKRPVWEVFTQNWNNPSYGGGSEQPGVWFDFYIADVHFIMLDCRYYRESSGRHDSRVDNPSMLGPVQLEWLKKTLKNSKGTFKILASSVPMSPGTKGDGPGGLDTWDGYTEERDEIHQFLHDNHISGVTVISADRHRSDVRRIPRGEGYMLYEFMSSVLTNYHTHPVVETPELIFGYNEDNSFGLVHFDTKANDPKMTFEIVTIDNETIWSMDIKLSQLK